MPLCCAFANSICCHTRSSNLRLRCITCVGLGYQASPALLLGANYIVTTADSTMANLQAHYALSKRTDVYAGAMIVNYSGDKYTAGVSANGASGASYQNNSIYAVGIRHKF